MTLPARLSTDDDPDDQPFNTATREIMVRALAHVPTPASLARRLDVTPSHVSRLLKGIAGLGIETCVLLADVLDEDPVVVLRTCGYERFSDMLDLLRQGRLPRPRARVYEALDRLSVNDRRFIARVIDRLLSDGTPNQPTPAPADRGVDTPRRGKR